MTSFGPWLPGLAPDERLARLRCLRTLVRLLAPAERALEAVLRDAEAGRDGALTQALEQMERIPALSRRRILATYADLHAPVRPRPGRPVSMEERTSCGR